VLNRLLHSLREAPGLVVSGAANSSQPPGVAPLSTAVRLPVPPVFSSDWTPPADYGRPLIVLGGALVIARVVPHPPYASQRRLARSKSKAKPYRCWVGVPPTPQRTRCAPEPPPAPTLSCLFPAPSLFAWTRGTSPKRACFLTCGASSPSGAVLIVLLAEFLAGWGHRLVPFATLGHTGWRSSSLSGTAALSALGVAPALVLICLFFGVCLLPAGGGVSCWCFRFVVGGCRVGSCGPGGWRLLSRCRSAARAWCWGRRWAVVVGGLSAACPEARRVGVHRRCSSRRRGDRGVVNGARVVGRAGDQ
jgi:hypothetical protein